MRLAFYVTPPGKCSARMLRLTFSSFNLTPQLAMQGQTFKFCCACLLGAQAVWESAAGNPGLGASFICSLTRGLRGQAEAEFFPALLLYGEGPAGIGGEGAAQAGLAQLLPKLRALGELLARLEAAAGNLLGQLGALCCEQTRKATILQGTPPCPLPFGWALRLQKYAQQACIVRAGLPQVWHNAGLHGSDRVVRRTWACYAASGHASHYRAGMPPGELLGPCCAPVQQKHRCNCQYE